jgi:hypothetical protein
MNENLPFEADFPDNQLDNATNVTSSIPTDVKVISLTKPKRKYTKRKKEVSEPLPVADVEEKVEKEEKLTKQKTSDDEENFESWDAYERLESATDVVESDPAHRVWLLSSKFFDKPVLKLHDLVLKELALSIIPDGDLAYAYAIKMDCIEEWLNMGFPELAKRRLAHMLFRLQLLRSIEGIERITQGGGTATSMILTPGQLERGDMSSFTHEEGPGLSAPRLSGVGGLVGKLKRKKRWWQQKSGGLA